MGVFGRLADLTGLGGLGGGGAGRLAREREAAARRVAPGPLADLLAAPVPEPDIEAGELPLLAVDLETTGLDARSDRVLSIGFVPVDGLQVRLAGARHIVVAAGVPVGQSATVHGLTDDVVAAGMPVADAVAEVVEAMRGRVLLAHFARIESEFLSAVCREVWGAPLVAPVVDTFAIEERLVRSPFDAAPVTGQLRLWATRERYGLPVYRAHEALTDAIACAELWLAQVARLAEDGPVTLRRLQR